MPLASPHIMLSRSKTYTHPSGGLCFALKNRGLVGAKGEVVLTLGCTVTMVTVGTHYPFDQSDPNFQTDCPTLALLSSPPPPTSHQQIGRFHPVLCLTRGLEVACAGCLLCVASTDHKTMFSSTS